MPKVRRRAAEAKRTPPATSDENTVRVQDPRDIRALAHPARMAIIDALATGDELTATECAALTGLSPSATAYHLNLLEHYGFAEPASARRDKRDRPWRATNRQRSFDLETSTPAGAAAAATVSLAYFDQSRTLGQEFMSTEHEEPEQWRRVASLANADLWLTAKETAEVSAALAAVLKPYRGRVRADRPNGSRRVRVMNMVVPHRKS